MGKLSTAEVLRLRAIKRVSGENLWRRSAQDDGFVGGLEIQLAGYAETPKDRKSQRLSEFRLLLFDGVVMAPFNRELIGRPLQFSGNNPMGCLIDYFRSVQVPGGHIKDGFLLCPG
jgi:hypothetical protein